MKSPIIAMLLGFLFTISTATAQENVKLDAEMKRALNKIVSNPQIPGISVAIASKDGLIWSGVAGLSRIEERQTVSQGHLFGIGDLSHQFIKIVILQLASDGLLNLNDTPHTILGDTVANIDNADTATLQQLLDHTSGIYSFDQNQDWLRRSRGIQLNPKYHWQKEEPLKYITSDQHSAIHEPGAATTYSKSNSTILGLIIEKTSGGLLEDEIRKRVLEPLNLKNTYYDGFESPPSGRLIGSYHLGTDDFIKKIGINAKFNFDGNRLINTSDTSLTSEGIASGIISTPRDLALFAATLTKKNAHIHSDILGFTADVVWLENSDLVVVSLVNIGSVNTGKNALTDYLNSYMQEIILPIVKKHAS